MQKKKKNEKKNVTQQKEKLHTWKYCFCNYIEYVEPKKKFFFQKKKKQPVQSYAAQDGPKYRGQWKNGS